MLITIDEEEMKISETLMVSKSGDAINLIKSLFLLVEKLEL